MNCLEFERLLDEGAPDALREAARAHAEACAVCARSLERARALESALDRHFAALASASEQAPLAGFTDRVLARVERGEARGVRWLTLPDALPWWVRAAAEPGVALASVVAALMLWRGGELMALARDWSSVGRADASRWSAWAASLRLDAAADAIRMVLAPAAGADWAVVVGVTLGVAPLLGLLGWALWQAGERIGGGTLASLR